MAEPLGALFKMSIFLKIAFFLYSSLLMARTYSDAVQNVTIIKLLYLIYSIWATKDSRLVMLLLVFKSTFWHRCQEEESISFFLCCVFVLHVFACIVNPGRQKSRFWRKKKSLVEFLLVCDYIKSIWLEHSQNKREFLSRVFVVNRKASGIFFWALFSPRTKVPPMYKFLPYIQISREEQWNSR